MAFVIFCLLLAPIFILSAGNKLKEDELQDLKWWKLASRIPEIYMVHNGFNNPRLSHYQSQNGVSNIPENFIELWRNKIVASIDFTNDTCSEDLKYLTSSATDKSWAIQMIDASGKMPSGIRRGALIWLGNTEECQEAVAPVVIINGTKYGGFSGRQCLFKWALNTNATGAMSFKTNLCVPSSCNSVILKNYTDSFRETISGLPIINETNTIFIVEDVDCSDHKRSWTGGDITYMTILALFCAVIITGTSFEILKKFQSQSEKAYVSFENENDQNDNASLNKAEAEPTTQYTTLADAKEEQLHKDSPPLSVQVTNKTTTDTPKSITDSVIEFFMCFSLYTNIAKLINVGNQKGQLTCLHGIRFLSMSWIILGHTFIFAAGSIDNMIDFATTMYDSFWFQAVSQGQFAVDTFFFLSGFLLAYLFLKEYSKTDKHVNWIYYYVHRIWRLSPAYFMLMGFYATLWLHLGSGPLWPKEADNGNCNTYWWRNILYINNLKPQGQMCMGWTWYLANDMQFYVISPLFLVFLNILPVVGIVLTGAVMLASWIATGIISAQNHYERLYAGDQSVVEWLQNMAQTADMFDNMYEKPYCRIGPYLIGILVGYILHKTKGQQKFMKLWMSAIGWAATSALLLSVVFGVYYSNMGKITAAAYNGLSRTAWSIGLGWVVFACLTGHGGPVNMLLSWKFWVPLSRLTYCAYLVHPMIMYGYYMSVQSTLHYQTTTMVVYYFGFLISSYLAAFAASLIFESPMMAMEKFILKRFRSN